MLKEKELKKIALFVLKQTKNYFDQTEVLLGTNDSTTIRFANNLIYQPMAVSSLWLRIRLIKNKKISVISSNSFSLPAIKKMVKTGKKLCLWQKKDKNFISLPLPKKIKNKALNSFNKKTFLITPQKLSQLVFPAINLAKEKKLVAAGKIEKSVDELAVANSLGVWQYQPSTSLFFSLVARNEKEKASAYSEILGQTIKDLKIKKTSQQTINTALKSACPQKIKPGTYEVIFMPLALQEVLPYFSWLGPNARIYHEQASYLKGKLGKKVFADKLTIIDKPLNKIAPSFFDFEGMPKKNLTIIKNGVVKNICYDSYYAYKYKHKNTSHALPAPNTEGPLPTNLVIKSGSSNLKKMIKKVKKGLLVNRLWYIRAIHFKQLVLTGMTRDGVFYIENGKIKYPVQNLRFTDSIPNIFKNIVEIGQECLWQKAMGGVIKIPPLRVSKFRFTS